MAKSCISMTARSPCGTATNEPARRRRVINPIAAMPDNTLFIVMREQEYSAIRLCSDGIRWPSGHSPETIRCSRSDRMRSPSDRPLGSLTRRPDANGAGVRGGLQFHAPSTLTLLRSVASDGCWRAALSQELAQRYNDGRHRRFPGACRRLTMDRVASTLRCTNRNQHGRAPASPAAGRICLPQQRRMPACRGS